MIALTLTVNITAYYSTTTLKDHAHYSEQASLLISMGFGVVNFLFALPAVSLHLYL
jgi:hypothetical protein